MNDWRDWAIQRKLTKQRTAWGRIQRQRDLRCQPAEPLEQPGTRSKSQQRVEKALMKQFRQQPLILVVDGQAEVLDEVATVLSGANFACRCCTTAEGAIAAAESFPPDLIISDVNLHGHSGLEMCERIRENPALREVPVMFLSGAQVPDIIRRGDALGGTYYLRKPFDPDVLVELIDTALGSSQLVAGDAGRRSGEPLVCRGENDS